MTQEHQVGSLNNCVGELQDAHHGYVESRREQDRLQEELSMKENVLRDTQIRNIHELGRRELKNYELMNSQHKNEETTMRQCRSSLLSCKKCKIRWFLWMILENFQEVNQITVGDCLTFPVSLQWFQVIVPCWAGTNVCPLTHGIHRDYRKTFLVINFLRLIRPEIVIKEFTLAHHKESEDQFHKLQGRRHLSQEMTNKVKTQFPCRHLQEGRRLWVLQYRWNFCRISWLDRKDSKYGNRNSTNSPIHNRSWCGKQDSKTVFKWFWFSVGSYVMEERSGDSWFFGRNNFLAIGFWNEFSKFWDAGREDCLGSEQDHPDGNSGYLGLTGTIGCTIAPKKRVCNFIHPKPHSPFPERLKLPYPDEEIFSGCEEDVSIRDGFTTWVKADFNTILERHAVDVRKALAEFREASVGRHDTSAQEYHFDSNVPDRSSVQKRLSIYSWNLGPRRGR